MRISDWSSDVCSSDLTALHFVPEAILHVRLRPDIKAMSRQARRWGEYNVLLYKLYRGRGMPSIGWSSGPRNWVNLLRRCPSLLRESQRPGWWWETNWGLGRLGVGRAACRE